MSNPEADHWSCLLEKLTSLEEDVRYLQEVMILDALDSRGAPRHLFPVASALSRLVIRLRMCRDLLEGPVVPGQNAPMDPFDLPPDPTL